MNLPDLTDRLHGKIALHTIVKTAGTIQHRATLDHSGIPYPDAICTIMTPYRHDTEIYYETHAAAPHTRTHFHIWVKCGQHFSKIGAIRIFLVSSK